jgi:hypothetical protein
MEKDIIRTGGGNQGAFLGGANLMSFFWKLRRKRDDLNLVVRQFQQLTVSLF